MQKFKTDCLPIMAERGPAGGVLAVRAAFVACVAVSMLMMAQGASAQKRAAAVFVDIVDQRLIRDTQAVIGRLVATRRSDIATRIAGIVGQVNFKVGDRVAREHMLVTLDASQKDIEKRANQAAIAAAEAGLSVARAKLKLAELAFRRQSDLKSSTAFSRSRFDDAKQTVAQLHSELGQADAQLQMAKVGLDRADYELKHMVIVAPFDGIVIARQAQPGQYMQAGGTIATLLDINDLEVSADVPGVIANTLRPGAKLDAVFESGVVRQVVVRTAIPVQNGSTRTRQVRFKVELADMKPSQIAVGATVTLKVPVSAERTVMTVPKDALLRGRGGWKVFAVKDNKAVSTPVVLGQAVGDRMEVVSGLKQSDVVVVRGNERLRPGQKVRPKRVAPSPPRQG
ncbi:MAG: RND family efflux transporter MFP subunit [Hyphomicrobiaceae bacterium]|jgi:RND family efflux transporter MFP subunit